MAPPAVVLLAEREWCQAVAGRGTYIYRSIAESGGIGRNAEAGTSRGAHIRAPA
jgi:hypothetical protein